MILKSISLNLYYTQSFVLLLLLILETVPNFDYKDITFVPYAYLDLCNVLVSKNMYYVNITSIH